MLQEVCSARNISQINAAVLFDNPRAVAGTIFKHAKGVFPVGSAAFNKHWLLPANTKPRT